MTRERIVPLIVFTFFVQLVLRIPASATDIDTLYARLYTQFQGSGDPASTINSWLASLQTDGTWPDINYAATDAAIWPPIYHLSRMQSMAMAYCNPVHPLYKSLTLKTGLLSAFDGWIAKNPQSSNWWWNYIGTQNTLGPIMILIKGVLSASQLGKGTAILGQAWTISLLMTADNLTSVAKITVWNGCIKNDAATVTNGVNAITSQLAITTAEGIQQDQSFQQHGAQLYSGGYGMEFASDCSNYAALCRGTSFAFSSGKLAVLSNYILSGQQRIIRGITVDHSVQGREITRQGSSHQKSTVMQICATMSLANPALAPQFDAFAARCAAWPAQPTSDILGNFHFWRSDFMTHRRGGYALSVRMCSNRTVAAELVNDEGLKSYYLGDGAAFLYKTGDEYFDLFPVWNWARVPGTTCQQQPSPPAMPGQYQKGTTAFVGGVSDGTCGATGFDYSRNGVTGRKAWFFFDREIVALGAGISCKSTLAVNTTVNQCRLNGPVTIAVPGGAKTVLGRGSHAHLGVSWMHHDSTGYFFFTSADSVMVNNDTQSGAWSDINTSQSATRVTDSVFCCWINHGAAPAGATYAYGMVPAISFDGMQAYATAHHCSILVNTTAAQAVRQDSLKTAGIVFYAPGPVKLTDSISVTSDRACIALVRESADSITLAVSNPLNAACTVHVSLPLHLSGTGAAWNSQQGTTVATMILPGGMDAGKSVVQTLYRNPTHVASAPIAQEKGLTVFRFVPGGLMVRIHPALLRKTGEPVLRVFTASGKLIGQSIPNSKNSSGFTFVKLDAAARGMIIVKTVSCESGGIWILPYVK